MATITADVGALIVHGRGESICCKGLPPECIVARTQERRPPQIFSEKMRQAGKLIEGLSLKERIACVCVTAALVFIF